MIGDLEVDHADPFFIWLIVHDLTLLILLYHLPLRSLSLHHILRRHIQLDIIELAHSVSLPIVTCCNFEIVRFLWRVLGRLGLL